MLRYFHVCYNPVSTIPATHLYTNTFYTCRDIKRDFQDTVNGQGQVDLRLLDLFFPGPEPVRVWGHSYGHYSLLHRREYELPWNIETYV